MKNYDKDNESPYIMYLDPKNLYGWPVSQKLPINVLNWKKIQQRVYQKIMIKIVINDAFLR